MATTKISRLVPFALFAFMTGSAWAQSVSGPVMGFVLEGSAGVRPLRGLPGAATMGPSLLRAAGYTQVVFAQPRAYALAVTRMGGQVVLLRNLMQQSLASALGIPEGVARIATSPSGDAAAFYYADSRRVQVVNGLPDSPNSVWNDEAPELPGGLTALAVSDNGAAVLAAGSGQVVLLTPDVGVRYLYTAAGSPSMAFLMNSQDAVIADGALNRVMLVRDPKGEVQISLAGDAAQHVSRPIAVSVSTDNRRIFVANAEPAGVAVLSLAGEDAVAMPCDCTPTGLERLADSSTFRLNNTGAGPIWLVDGASSPPRLVFVPYQAPPVPTVAPRPLPVRQPVRTSSILQPSEK